MSSDIGEDVSLNSDSEDELDWEEVEVPQQERHLEITLDAPSKSKIDPTKKKVISHAERLIRIDCHKIHTVALIANGRVRNQWINEPLLHARLLSLTPLHLQNAFGAIHKSRIPDQNQRGRMFERAMGNLTAWWADTFFEIVPKGHIRNRPYDEIQRKLEIRGLHIKDDANSDEISLDVETLEDIVGDEVEPIRSSKSLMKHALMRSGSRDTSAQLFTALCRGLGIPARLVVSIQSVPWQAGIGKPKPQYERKKLKGKGKTKEVMNDEVDGSPPPAPSIFDSNLTNERRLDGNPVPSTSEKAKGKQKAAHVIKLRKTKSKGQVLGVAPSKLESPDPLTTPPVIWTEVFSRPDAKWFPIDPIRGIVNKRKVFDPTPSTTTGNAPISLARKTKVENRMVYVIAFEEDGYARDVTRRYAKDFGAKVAKMQGGSSAPNVGGGGKGRQAWWDKVVNCIHRPFLLHRDDLEDQELEAAQLSEGMPNTVSGFKDHPLYALERHLKQTETIYPPPPTTPELGKFRGEPVYPRSSVVSLKTAENWMRSTGRSVIAGEQPMKMVKLRTGTVNRMRELEVLKDDLRVAGQDGVQGEGREGTGGSSSGGEIMQGLYAYSQTEAYVSPPVVGGKVPKNNFGNIDLYVPSMLPKGAVHVPFKGVAKIARKLGFDFAEAVTGFEFKKRRAFPVIEGVVVAIENEATLLEAFWEAEREAEEKARIKKEDRVLKQWTRLIHGLRIRQRLQEQYGSKDKGKAGLGKDQAEPSVNDGMETPQVVADVDHDDAAETAGGFLAGADRVVQAFHLPKNTHVVLPSSPLSNLPVNLVKNSDDEGEMSDAREEPELETYDLEDDLVPMDVDGHVDTEAEVSSSKQDGQGFVPKTMQQLAEEANRRKDERRLTDDEDGVEVIITPASLHVRSAPTMKTRATPSHVNKRNTRADGARKTRRTPASIQKRKRVADDDEDDDGDDTPSSAADDEDEHLLEDDYQEPSRSGPSRRGRSGARGQGPTTPTVAKPIRPRPKPKPKVTLNASLSAAAAIVTTSMTMEVASTEPNPTSTPSGSARTLRPRASKSAAQIERERQSEEAFRKAVAR